MVGGVAATYIVAGGSLPAITAGTMVTLAVGAAGTSRFGRRPWRAMLEQRVAAYWQESDALDHAMTLIGVDYLGVAMHSLRRAGLNARGRTVLRIPGATRTDTALSLPPRHLRPGRPGERRGRGRARSSAGRDRGQGQRVDGWPADPSIVATSDVPQR